MVNILGGDFNTIDDPILDVYPPTTKITQITKLTYLCCTCLRDIYRIIYPDKQSFTWRGPHSASRLDCIYVNKNVEIVQALMEPSSYSDHDMAITQLNIPLPDPRGKGIARTTYQYINSKNFKKSWRQDGPI